MRRQRPTKTIFFRERNWERKKWRRRQRRQSTTTTSISTTALTSAATARLRLLLILCVFIRKDWLIFTKCLLFLQLANKTKYQQQKSIESFWSSEAEKNSALVLDNLSIWTRMLEGAEQTKTFIVVCPVLPFSFYLCLRSKNKIAYYVFIEICILFSYAYSVWSGKKSELKLHSIMQMQYAGQGKKRKAVKNGETV